MIETQYHPQMLTLPHYYKWVVNLVYRYIGKRVLDAGCGGGDAMQWYLSGVDYCLAVDREESNVEAVLARFHRDNIQGACEDITASNFTRHKDKNFDTIISLDVLEHIQNDIEQLKKFYDILNEGGSLILKVPALKFLYGTIDEASHHARRYSKKELLEKGRSAGFAVEKCIFMNFLGVWPYYLKSRILRENINFSATFSKEQLSIMNRWVPFFRTVDFITGNSFGLSLVGVFKKDKR